MNKAQELAALISEVNDVVDETSNKQLLNIFNKYGKSGVTKFKKLSARKKPNQMVKIDKNGRPMLVTKTSKQKMAGRKSGKKSKAKKTKGRKLSTNIRKSAKVAKKVARLHLAD